jgi:DNA-binding transcriptional LysR family regulator
MPTCREVGTSVGWALRGSMVYVASAMSDTLTALRLFVSVARTGSFSRAGRQLGLSQSSASRLIASLERDVGTPLLRRTTRVVALTEAGKSYLAEVEPILVALDDANHAVRGVKGLHGMLRLHAPSSIANREIAPRLPRFLEQHPALRIDLRVADVQPDLLGQDIAVAIRLGSLVDSTATARVVGRNERVAVAAPAYLKRAGTPATPRDLDAHDLVIGPPGSGPEGWTFERDGKAQTIRRAGRVAASANETATALAIAGLGIASTSLWACRRELEEGTLIRVLSEYAMGFLDVHVVFPAGGKASPAARAFAGYLASELERDGLGRTRRSRPRQGHR